MNSIGISEVTIKLYELVKVIILKYGQVYHCDNDWQNDMVNFTALNVHMNALYAYGFKRTIIEYFTCKMNLPVKIQPEPLEEQTVSLSAHVINDPVKYLLTLISQTYEVEIITGLKQKKSDEYFSFIYLFDTFTWLTSILLLTTGFFILKFLLRNKIRLQEWIRLLTTQSSPLFTRKFSSVLKNLTRSRRISIVMIVLITIQSASILTMSFKSLLLNSYSNIKFYPIISSVNDILVKEDLSVLLDPWHIPKLSAIFGEEISTILLRRVKQIPKYKDQALKENIFPQDLFLTIVRGQSVAMWGTRASEIFEQVYDSWKSRFTICDNKYSPNLLNLIVNKKNAHAELVNKLFKRIVESGIYIYSDNYLRIFSKLIRNEESTTQNYPDDTLIKTIELDEFFNNTISILILGSIIGVIVLVFETQNVVKTQICHLVCRLFRN